MRTIDRYLLWQFFQVFMICFLSLAGLYIVIDAFSKLDNFLDHARQHGNLAATMARHYGFQSLAFFNRTSGVLALAAAMFTVTWIQRHNEMTALLAAGIPRLRVLRTVLIACVLIALGAAAAREFVLPGIRHELRVDARNLSGELELNLHSRYDNVTDILLAGSKAVVSGKKITSPSFILPPPLAKYGKQLAAEEARFVEAAGGRPSGYLLSKVRTPTALLTSSSLTLGDGSIAVATPKDVPWLEADQVFVVSRVSFELLASGADWRDFASLRELATELRNPSTELGPDVRVAVHSRVLQPLLDITLLMLGLPLVVSSGARNPFIAIGYCLTVVTAFFLVSLGAQSLGGTGLISPVMAAWAPLVSFGPIAVGMCDPLRS